MRLAEEYDAAQERGEVASNGQRGPEKAVEGDNSFRPVTAADLGLRRDEIHEARKLRDAERAAAMWAAANADQFEEARAAGRETSSNWGKLGCETGYGARVNSLTPNGLPCRALDEALKRIARTWRSWQRRGRRGVAPPCHQEGKAGGGVS